MGWGMKRRPRWERGGDGCGGAVCVFSNLRSLAEDEDLTNKLDKVKIDDGRKDETDWIL